MNAAQFDPLQSRLNRITTKAFEAYWQHEEQHTLSAVPHLTRTLPALAEVNAFYEHTSLIQWLLTSLGDTNSFVGAAAAQALGKMGEKAAEYPGVLKALLKCLRDGLGMSVYAAQALGKMGEKAAEHPGVLKALLLNCLWERDEYVSLSASEALEQLGEKAATPEAIEMLLNYLRDTKEELVVRIHTPRVLGKMGKKAAEYPGILMALLECLRDTNSLLRSAAAEALGKMGEKAAEHPEVIESHLKRLQDQYLHVRVDAAEALGKMGEKAAEHPEVIESLLEHLRDRKEGDLDRYDAARELWELEKMGEKAAEYPGVLKALLECLRDQSVSVRVAAAQALGTWQEDWGLRFWQAPGSPPCFCHVSALSRGEHPFPMEAPAPSLEELIAQQKKLLQAQSALDAEIARMKDSPNQRPV